MSSERMLEAVLDDAIEPLFWGSVRVGVPSAWYGHVPFAHWLVAAQRPSVVVELGTHFGVSYFAFCHAALLSGGSTQCYAVDTWRGDEHAGFYGDEVFADVEAFNTAFCPGISTLLRTTFDAAVTEFADGTIDLLHIDGLHTYEAVRSDYETWLPKLSPRGIVLFHDIAVRDGDFGVWRLWEELAGRHPSLEFNHAHGLGLLAVGSEVTGPAASLCGLTEPRNQARIRDRFCLMGELVRLRASPAQT